MGEEEEQYRSSVSDYYLQKQRFIISSFLEKKDVASFIEENYRSYGAYTLYKKFERRASDDHPHVCPTIKK